MIDRLRELGIDPELLPPLAVREIDGDLLIPAGRRYGRTLGQVWPLVTGEPWDAGMTAWRLMPDEARKPHVLVTLGALDTLALASLIYRVGHDGAVYRRPSSCPLLDDIEILALPETAPGLPVEWITDPGHGAEALILEVLHDDLETIFLAARFPAPEDQPTAPSGLPAPVEFVERLFHLCLDAELTAAFPIAPWTTTWSELLAGHPGAGKPHAFAAVLEFTHRAALARKSLAPTQGDPT